MKKQSFDPKQKKMRKQAVHRLEEPRIKFLTVFSGMRWTAIFIILSIVSFFYCSPDSELPSTDIVFQTTTIAALLDGQYDGNLSMKKLKKHGDFGLGTFQALNGEMIVFSDTVYQIRYDGKVCHVHDSVKTPFAVVTDYKPDIEFPIQNSKNLERLQNDLDRKLAPADMIYAIKIHGMFEYVKTRSVPEQKKPYHRLADVIQNQSIFEVQKIKGTVIGFRFPEYLKGINVPGYHFHFLDDTRTRGGHLLDCIIKEGNAEIDIADKLFLMLPEHAENRGAESPEFDQDELDRIEKGRK
jgi:acetolactate decarboxylase